MTERKHFLRFVNGAFVGFAFARGPDAVADAGEDWREVDAEVIDNMRRGIKYRITDDGAGVEPAPLTRDEMAVRVRAKRDLLLEKFDHNESDASKQRLGVELYEKWREYLQKLRDLPQQPGFPDAINWPYEPGKEPPPDES